MGCSCAGLVDREDPTTAPPPTSNRKSRSTPSKVRTTLATKKKTSRKLTRKLKVFKTSGSTSSVAIRCELARIEATAAKVITSERRFESGSKNSNAAVDKSAGPTVRSRARPEPVRLELDRQASGKRAASNR